MDLRSAAVRSDRLAWTAFRLSGSWPVADEVGHARLSRRSGLRGDLINTSSLPGRPILTRGGGRDTVVTRGGGRDTVVTRGGGRDTVINADDRRADLDGVALVHQQRRHCARERGRQLDHGLARLHLEQNVVDLDLVTDRDPPADDLGFHQSLTGIGQAKGVDGHQQLLQYASERSTMSSTRSRSGRYSSSTRLGG